MLDARTIYHGNRRIPKFGRLWGHFRFSEFARTKGLHTGWTDKLWKVGKGKETWIEFTNSVILFPTIFIQLDYGTYSITSTPKYTNLQHWFYSENTYRKKSNNEFNLEGISSRVQPCIILSAIITNKKANLCRSFRKGSLEIRFTIGSRSVFRFWFWFNTYIASDINSFRQRMEIIPVPIKHIAANIKSFRTKKEKI